ncbi:MAG: hypothetical protein ACK5MH_09010 [Bacteroidales bacterium]
MESILNCHLEKREFSSNEDKMIYFSKYVKNSDFYKKLNHLYKKTEKDFISWRDEFGQKQKTNIIMTTLEDYDFGFNGKAKILLGVIESVMYQNYIMICNNKKSNSEEAFAILMQLEKMIK